MTERTFTPKIRRFGQTFPGVFVVPKPVLTVFVFALPILIVAYGVLMGGYALAQALQDPVASIALRWIAGSCLILLVIDLILLVGSLGVNALAERERP